MHALKRTAVIGGGWAGLACAVELAAAGRPVTLFESARQLGGRARSVDWNGLAIDNGQHLMVGAYHQTLRMLRRLRSDALLQRTPLDLRVPGFRLALPRLPEPLHLAWGLLRAQGLSWQEKYAAVRFIETLRAQQFKLEQDQPADAFLREHRQSPALVERLWAPICIAALNTPLATASAQVFCNVLHDSLLGARGDSDLVMNRSALGHLLPEAAATFITALGGEVHLASKVSGIRHTRDGYALAPHADQSFGQVVIATHPTRVPALLADLPTCATLAASLTQLTWQPILTLWLRFAQAPAFPFPMIGLGDGHAPWAFERNDLAPGVVAIVTSAEGAHLALPHEQLRDAYLALLEQTLGPLPALDDWLCIVEKRATFACTPGLWRPGNRTPQAGLYLAGDYTAGPYPATLEGAVRSGVECARLILE